MSEWQPIDTAPKDGMIILLARSDGAVYAGYWGLSGRVRAMDATKKYPWVILDETNGVNSLMNGTPGADRWAFLPDAHKSGGATT